MKFIHRNHKQYTDIDLPSSLVDYDVNTFALIDKYESKVWGRRFGIMLVVCPSHTQRQPFSKATMPAMPPTRTSHTAITGMMLYLSSACSFALFNMLFFANGHFLVK